MSISIVNSRTKGWNTTYAKVIYNASACVYSDYEFANQDSGFAWLACNIRLFGFESYLCSRATSKTPITPTCVNVDPTGELWEWSWDYQPTGERFETVTLVAFQSLVQLHIHISPSLIPYRRLIRETHSFWVDWTNGHYAKYQWSGL